MDTLTEEVWEFASKATITPFSVITSMFHQHFVEIDFFNQLWSCYSSFTFKQNQLHMIIRYYLVINQSSVSSVFAVEKE
jgi:hypothetical protein